MGRATEKVWPKRPSDCQLQEAWKKDSDRAITPAAEAVHVPATWGHQGSRTSSSCTTLTGAELPRAKNRLASMHTESLRSCPTLCNPVDCGLPGFSIREGGSLGKNTGAYWPTLVAIPLAALAANSPEYLVLPEPLQPKQLHHLHTWFSWRQTKVL